MRESFPFSCLRPRTTTGAKALVFQATYATLKGRSSTALQIFHFCSGPLHAVARRWSSATGRTAGPAITGAPGLLTAEGGKLFAVAGGLRCWGARGT